MHERDSTRVLVVEDEPSDALLVRRSLLRADAGEGSFEVRHATTLAEALDWLGREAADVVLLDLGLPDSDGLDTVVRSRARAPDLPLVVLTGSDDHELAMRTLEAGADGHLVKGELGPRVLPRALLEAIRRRGARPERLRALAPPERDRRIAHDLPSLHALVLGNAELLRDEVAHQPRLRVRADAIVRAARLAAAFDEPARSEAGDDAVELSTFVRRAQGLLRAVLPEGVELRVALAQGLPVACVAAERLFGALLELVSNALESIGDREGTLTVATGQDVLGPEAHGHLVAYTGFEPGPHVWLEVRDTGRGFDAAALLARMPAAGVSDAGYGASPLEKLLADGAALLVDSRQGTGAVFRILLRPASPGERSN